MKNPKTLADAIVAIEMIEGLPLQRRRDLLSAISRTSSYLRRPPQDIPTDAPRLRRLLKTIHPAQAGISAKSLSNVFANLASALVITGFLPQSAAPVELSGKWQDLMSSTDVPFHRVSLSRFMQYCSSHNIEPDAVSSATFDDFRSHVDERLLRRDPDDLMREAIATWNKIIATSGQPYSQIGRRLSERYRSAPLNDYPLSLQSDIQRYIDRLSHTNLFDECGPDKPLKPTSLRNVQAHLRQYLAALVEAGVERDDLTSLRVAISVNNLKRAGDQIMRRTQRNSAPVGVFNIFSTCLGIARHYVDLPETEVKEIKRLKARIAPDTSGMTSKNRERLDQFQDFQNILRLIALPEVLMAEAKENPGNARSPLKAMWAAVITILLSCPMRIKNLANLDVEQHIRIASGKGRLGRGSIIHVSIDGGEVKNGLPIDFQLHARHSELLRYYLDHFRHRLSDIPSSALFPRQSDGKPRTESNLGQDLSREIHRRTGLSVNPHFFRHFTAYLYLKEHPGDFETVRRLLKHKNLQTTMSFYAELSNRWAHDHYQETVLNKWMGSDA